MHFSLVRIEIKFFDDVTQMQTRVPQIANVASKGPATIDGINYELLMRKEVADIYENIRKV